MADYLDYGLGVGMLGNAKGVGGGGFITHPSISLGWHQALKPAVVN